MRSKTGWRFLAVLIAVPSALLLVADPALAQPKFRQVPSRPSRPTSPAKQQPILLPGFQQSAISKVSPPPPLLSPMQQQAVLQQLALQQQLNYLNSLQQQQYAQLTPAQLQMLLQYQQLQALQQQNIFLNALQQQQLNALQVQMSMWQQQQQQQFNAILAAQQRANILK